MSRVAFFSPSPPPGLLGWKSAPRARTLWCTGYQPNNEMFKDARTDPAIMSRIAALEGGRREERTPVEDDDDDDEECGHRHRRMRLWEPHY